MAKLQGFDFWRKTLKEARFVVAPMVDQSELAWRLLSRRHGAQLCYTPMLHAQVFVRDTNYRRENLLSEVCEEDRPLITQFCANDPEVFVQAALLAQDYCDAIDLNLGCPQMIAKRGHYGVFLQDEWELLEKMVRLANEKLSVPVTCKIRVFEDMGKTVRYAQMLEKAGCQLLTVHGRTKDQKGSMTGVASWEHIKAVRKAVNIPVFANGNIQHLSDVERCIQETGVQGVMSAEGNLHNPALFEGRSPPVWEMAEEYLEVVRRHPPCSLSYVRAHLFKLWHHTLQIHQDLREELAKVKTLEALADVSRQLKQRCQEEMAKEKGVEDRDGDLPFPHWICQPYIRPVPKPPVTNGTGPAMEAKRPVCQKRALEDLDGAAETLSKNKQKKRSRNPHKNFCPDQKPKYLKCEQCGNPKGNKCVFNLCRGCCKKKAFKEVADCPSHGLRFKTKAEKRKAEEEEQTERKQPEKSSSLQDSDPKTDVQHQAYTELGPSP
ncbi:tRNA-dihydrouridine(16/17) synthase [NAD(P)(+)]-like [Melanotaenia boesemani]|uniref:tRNA-dihydrouridine(16/17) synthase [NAD(P)(+)]-like n=1 Tax=Melanotaenia boesemani TaxID=1250792 RepID=UPI001C049573|nr:tRNA-dihydrouridine(16/17) synthase [NAD(P)(+)]-like [Melanotaenia boesemani]XP_041828896.1 tRNA-dihydrouridine(16/17) synthase [NAD(P)(+)]-like [Melanotaenia boesemani]XP_041828905.1 tRNA-dihydrouridine(16/17) synthase [NAD(P)(+)]-like [Melanotaenia boesemani]XP_041828911.1 tRNA-dihydrouridine(16/17) synthase [NAD(P)(+)]-like [Melanotaenia boesemani]